MAHAQGVFTGVDSQGAHSLGPMHSAHAQTGHTYKTNTHRATGVRANTGHNPPGMHTALAHIRDSTQFEACAAVHTQREGRKV